MNVIDYDITYTNSAPVIHLYFLGDIHAGTIHCAEDELRETINDIKNDPKARVIGMGDYGEFITPKDPRFDPNLKSIAPWLRDDMDDIGMAQVEWVTHLFKPIKKKIVGLLYGNHEEAIRIHNHTNVIKHLCRKLEVPNLGYSSFVRFRFKRESSNESHIIKGAFTHGSGSGITKGSKVNRLRRFMDDFEADLYAYAHVHDIDQQRRPYITVSPAGKIQSKEQIGVLTGCWFRTYTQGITSSYGERKAYPPTVIGCPLVILHPTKKLKAQT